jgi:hypothetical protein
VQHYVIVLIGIVADRIGVDHVQKLGPRGDDLEVDGDAYLRQLGLDGDGQLLSGGRYLNYKLPN